MRINKKGLAFFCGAFVTYVIIAIVGNFHHNIVVTETQTNTVNETVNIEQDFGNLPNYTPKV